MVPSQKIDSKNWFYLKKYKTILDYKIIYLQKEYCKMYANVCTYT